MGKNIKKTESVLSIKANEFQSKLKEGLSDYLTQILATKKVPPVKQFIQKSSLAVQVKSELQQLRRKQNTNREKIKKGEKLYLEETLNRLNKQKVDLETKLKPEQIKITPVKSKFIITGKIIDNKTKVGIPGLTIALFSKGLKKITVLTEIHTDENGFFMKEFPKIQLDDILKSKNKIYFKILSEKEKQVYESKTGFSPEIGKIKVINLAIDGNQLPDEVKQGKINKEILEKRIIILNQQKDIIHNRFLIRSL